MCLLKMSPENQKKLYSYENFIETLFQRESKKIVKIKSAPPKEFIATLDMKDENLAKLHQHLSSEKERVK